MSEASTTASTETSGEGPGESGAGTMVGLLFGAIFTIFLSLFLYELTPYPHWAGDQSWLWWLVRWPLVFVVSLVLLILMTMGASMLIPASERAGPVDLSGAGSAMFFCLLIVVGANGESLMNVYNAAFAKPLFVLARCDDTRSSPGSGYRSTRSTSHVKFQLLDGPDAGDFLSTGGSSPSTTGEAVSVARGNRYVLEIRRSWMGVSIVEVRYPDDKPPLDR